MVSYCPRTHSEHEPNAIATKSLEVTPLDPDDLVQGNTLLPQYVNGRAQQVQWQNCNVWIFFEGNWVELRDKHGQPVPSGKAVIPENVGLYFTGGKLKI